MKDKKRHKAAYQVIRRVVQPFFKWKFNYHFPKVNQVEGPYIVLANHNLELDPVLMSFAFPKHMYFVASEHIMRKGFGTWFLMYFLKPIIRVKGKVEVKTVAEILRTVRGGDNVCIFAEGARSFNGLTGEILPSTGKMVKRSGASLITYRFEGGYFSQPRWSTTLRRGRITGKVAGIYTAEQLKAMSEAEINEVLQKDLFEDAYQTQKREPIAFKGKDLAVGIQSTLFMCPHCGNIDTMSSHASTVSCSCGAEYTYTQFGYLENKDGTTQTITEWDLWQQKMLKEKFDTQENKTEAFFSDQVTLYHIDTEHQITKEEKGTLVAYNDRIQCCGQTFYFEDMLGLDIFSRNFIVMNYGKDADHYEIKGDLHFNALKYLYLYRIVKGAN